VNPVLAIDCDLHKIYAMVQFAQERPAVICNAVSDMDKVYDFVRKNPDTQVLFEIASPVDYSPEGAGKAVAYHKRRWTIWNVAMACETAITNHLSSAPSLLVAPSSTWTKGHPLAVRHAVAGCKAKNKDLRECEAMIWFYKQEPHRWVTLRTFLAGL